MHKAVLVALAAMLLFVAPARADNGVRLDDLRVERKAEPVGIDVDKPRFSWVVESSVRDLEQKAYRVQLKTGNRFVWDSGTVRSVAVVRRRVHRPEAGSGDALRLVRRRADQARLGERAFRLPHRPLQRRRLGGQHVDRQRAAAARRRRSTARRGSGRPRRPRRSRPPSRARSARRSAARVSAEIVITADDSYTAVGQRQAAGRDDRRRERVAAGAPLLDRAGPGPQRHRRAHEQRPELPRRPARRGPRDATPTARRRASATDATWKAAKTFPEDFARPDFDDSALGRRGRAGGVRRPARGAATCAPRATPRAPRRCSSASFDVTGRVRNATLFYAAGGYADFTAQRRSARATTSSRPASPTTTTPSSTRRPTSPTSSSAGRTRSAPSSAAASTA